MLIGTRSLSTRDIHTILLSLMFLTVLSASEGFSQDKYSKIGGICFRIDDDHPISNWYDYAKVFDKYGYHFTFAQNLELEDGVDDYFTMIRNLQASGQEMADHTPNHTTLYFTVRDTFPYSGLPGVDHIRSNTVYLQYDPAIDTSMYHDQVAPGGAIIDIKGGKAYSRTPGAFKEFGSPSQGVYLWGVYIPGTGQLFSVGNLSNVWNADTSDIDTMKLFSPWGEDIPIRDTMGVWCHFVGQYNVHLTNDAFGLLLKRTREICYDYQIVMPTTWIEPGVMGPFPYELQTKQISGGQYGGYTAAANDPPISLKCYNEYDPDQDKRYGMEWGDFFEDSQNLQTLKSIIADGVARHYFLVGHSHFNNLLGGWAGYLGRMDSLLAWCKENYKRIQVVTYSEMAHDLYDLQQNPYVNIIPPLNVDLDNNGVPDGYYAVPRYTDGTLDTLDGVLADGGRSYKISGTGAICSLVGLAGVEKGQNDFSIWTKGAPGDTISVTISFSGYPGQTFKFPATTSYWKNYTLLQSANGNTNLVVPADVSYIQQFTVRCISFSSGTVKISGMSIRGKLPTPLKIVSSPDTIVTAGALISSRIQVASANPGDTIFYSLSGAPSWLQISTTGVLSGFAPSYSGIFPMTIVARDQHSDTDSVLFDLHVVAPSQSTIRIVSSPDTVVAPNATYYYPIYATGSNFTDTLSYSKLSGPKWLNMSPGGILSGAVSLSDSTTYRVSIAVKDQHADADTQSFSIAIHPILLDGFNYTDSPLNHGWLATLGGGTVSVGFDSVIHERFMSLSTSNDLGFGVDRYGRWLANTITAYVKSSSSFVMSVWFSDSNGVSTYVRYLSGDGKASINPDNTISYYLGAGVSDGKWHSLGRNINVDLSSVNWGSKVRRILGISIRGTVQIANLAVGNNINVTVLNGSPSVARLFELEQNYPNPFNPSTTIQFILPEEATVVLQVFNVLGQKITEIDAGRLNPGVYSRLLDMSLYASGVYFCRMKADGVDGDKFISSRKMLLLK
jgi:hypothetical protein